MPMEGCCHADRESCIKIQAYVIVVTSLVQAVTLILFLSKQSPEQVDAERGLSSNYGSGEKVAALTVHQVLIILAITSQWVFATLGALLLIAIYKRRREFLRYYMIVGSGVFLVGFGVFLYLAAEAIPSGTHVFNVLLQAAVLGLQAYFLFHVVTLYQTWRDLEVRQSLPAIVFMNQSRAGQVA